MNISPLLCFFKRHHPAEVSPQMEGALVRSQAIQYGNL